MAVGLCRPDRYLQGTKNFQYLSKNAKNVGSFLLNYVKPPYFTLYWMFEINQLNVLTTLYGIWKSFFFQLFDNSFVQLHQRLRNFDVFGVPDYNRSRIRPDLLGVVSSGPCRTEEHFRFHSLRFGRDRIFITMDPSFCTYAAHCKLKRNQFKPLSFAFSFLQGDFMFFECISTVLCGVPRSIG